MVPRFSLDAVVKVEPDPAEFIDPRLPRLLAWWRGRCGEASPPPVTAIDALDLRFILGWLMVIEAIEGGVDFRYRLYGSKIVDVMGWDLTGRKVSDTFPEVAGFFCDIYRAALQHRHPVLTRHTPPRAVLVAQWERLILPFVGADGQIARFLVGAVVLGHRKITPTRYPWPMNGNPSDESALG